MSEVAESGFRHVAPEIAPRDPSMAHDGSPEVAGPRAHDGSPEVAPRQPGTGHDGSPEVASPTDVDSFTRRLSRLGAPLDMIDAVRAHWDEEWGPDDVPKAELVRMSDAELSGLIAGVQREHVENTMTEDEEAAARRTAAVDAAHPEAERLVTEGATVATLLEWVGDNEARAQAVYDVENDVHGDKARVTLLGPLEELLTEPEGE